MVDAATESEVLAAIEPKSDQINADDLTGGRTMDVTIIATKSYQDDQGRTRIACRLDGMTRVYRPCVTMVRLLVVCWGGDSRDWIGRRIRLYTDQGVTFGRDRVGGLRISHASHIAAPIRVTLTERRGQRREWVVQPLTTLLDVLKAAGLTVEQVDAWRAGLTPPRCPVAELDQAAIDQLAAWLHGDADRLDAIRGKD